MVSTLVAALVGKLYIGRIFLQKGKTQLLQSIFKCSIPYFIALLTDIAYFCMAQFMEIGNSAEGNVMALTDNLVVFVSHGI